MFTQTEGLKLTSLDLPLDTGLKIEKYILGNLKQERWLDGGHLYLIYRIITHFHHAIRYFS